MTDVFDGVRDHDRASGLTAWLNTALTILGPEDQRLTPHQRGALDQFHTRGLSATAEVAKLVGITADMSVLVVGKLRASGPPPSLDLGVVMGPDFAQLAANLERNLMEGRLGILTAVFEAALING